MFASKRCRAENIHRKFGYRLVRVNEGYERNAYIHDGISISANDSKDNSGGGRGGGGGERATWAGILKVVRESLAMVMVVCIRLFMCKYHMILAKAKANENFAICRDRAAC